MGCGPFCFDKSEVSEVRVHSRNFRYKSARGRSLREKKKKTTFPKNTEALAGIALTFLNKFLLMLSIFQTRSSDRRSRCFFMLFVMY